jgi:hypothetical protein
VFAPLIVLVVLTPSRAATQPSAAEIASPHHPSHRIEKASDARSREG